MATGTYTPPPAGPVTAAAPRSEPVPVVPPPATPTQEELDAMSAGTYDHTVTPQAGVPRRERDVRPGSSGPGYTTR